MENRNSGAAEKAVQQMSQETDIDFCWLYFFVSSHQNQ